MKRSVLFACVLAAIVGALASLVAGRASAQPPDVSPPTCTATGMAGPPTQAAITVSDTGGLASVVVTQADNADVPVPPFTVGTTNPLTVTATKIDQSKSSTVVVVISDTTGHQTYCRVVFEPGSTAPAVTVDSAPPTCGIAAMTGPPATATFTVQDVGSGLASVVVTTSTNADTPVPSFVAGTTSPLVVTATKIDQSQSSTVTLLVTDVAGFSQTCTATFLPLNVTPARVRGVSAAQTAGGVRVRWRTASELGIVGFNVYRSVGAKRIRANERLVAARGGLRGHAYAFLVRGVARGARYWVQAVNADGSRTWLGVARAGR